MFLNWKTEQIKSKIALDRKEKKRVSTSDSEDFEIESKYFQDISQVMDKISSDISDQANFGRSSNHAEQAPPLHSWKNVLNEITTIYEEQETFQPRHWLPPFLWKKEVVPKRSLQNEPN